MGVKGFTKYLASCEVPCYTVEQLMPGSLLLIDGNAWMFKLFQSITNTSDTYKGDGYRELDDMIQHEVQYWTLERRMELVVYFDGPTSQFKAATATKRGEMREQQWGNIYNFITDGVVYDHDEYPLPPLWSQQLRATLHDCQVHVIDASGEADAVMAAAANQAIAAGRTAYCISEDSDFYFFRDTPSVRFTTLSRRTETVDVYRRATIARILCLSETQLVELALLIGNDYTSHFSRSQFADVSIRSRDIDELKSWLVSQGPNYQLSSVDSDLQTVLCFSRDLYELRDVSKYAVDEDDANDLLRLSDLDVSELLDWEVKETDAIGIGDAALAYMEYIFLKSTDSSPTPLSHHVTEQYLQALSHMLDVLSEGNIDIEPSHKVPSWRDLLFTHHYQLVCSQLICKHELYVHPQHLFNANIFYDELSKVYDDVELNLASMALNNISETAVKSTDVKEKQSAKDKKSANFPKTLPIDEHRSTILNKIDSDRVTIIHGETGCGKSSRVPVMILEESNRRNEQCKMMVSQPRRIAASALMKRLRPALGDQIGLHMGHGVRESSRSTKIYFVTTGYLVRLLAHKPSYFDDHTHVIIDEVHERSVDGDLVCHFVKKLLDYNSNIRVVLMSATMNIELYQNYFAGFGDMRCLSVGVRCHPLEINHLEDIRKSLPPRPDIMKCITSIEDACNRWKPGRDDVEKGMLKEQYKLAYELVARCVQVGTGVLIFVAGMTDMIEITERFSAHDKYKLCYIHADIPFEEQENAFDPVQPHEIKVVIATNAAESSITLPDVDVVICLGSHKAVAFDAFKGEKTMHQQFICKASATQRAGRTGRVRPGKVYRLYTEALYNRLPMQGEAEILCSPLEETILTLRVMLENSPEFTGVVPILEELIEQPPMESIDLSFQRLYNSYLLTAPNDLSHLTPTGRLVGALPVDISLGRLVTYGVRLGVMYEAVILAAALSQPKTLFYVPSRLANLNPVTHCSLVRKAFLCANKYDRGMYSEPLMMWQLLEAYRDMPQSKQASWCSRNGLIATRMKYFDLVARNLLARVSELCPKDQHVTPREYREDELVNVLRLILVWSCDDNFIVAKVKKNRPIPNQICFSGVLEEAHLNCLFPKDILPWDQVHPIYQKISIPIPAQNFISQFGLLDCIMRIVKHLREPTIVWVQCQDITGDNLHGCQIVYVNQNGADTIVPRIINAFPETTECERDIYLVGASNKRAKDLKVLHDILKRSAVPYVFVALHGREYIKVTAAHIALRLEEVQNAFDCPCPCTFEDEEQTLTAVVFSKHEESGLFNDLHVGQRLYNAYKSTSRDFAVYLNKSEAMKLEDRKTESASQMIEEPLDGTMDNGDGKREDVTFAVQSDCHSNTWKHVKSRKGVVLPRGSVPGCCYYLGKDILVGIGQSMLVIKDGTTMCSGITLCPPGKTWIGRALACMDRQIEFPDICSDDGASDITREIDKILKQTCGDEVAYNEDLVYLVDALYKDMHLPPLRHLINDVVKNTHINSPDQGMLRLYDSAKLDKTAVASNYLPFPCPRIGCSTQCLSMDELEKHFKNDHNLPDDEIITYKSKNMNGRYILKGRKVHECGFSQCKKKFLCTRDAKDHFAAAHGLCVDVSKKVPTIQAVKEQDPLIRSESSREFSEVGDKASRRSAPVRVPCPLPGCTVQCVNTRKLQRHMKDDHLIPQEDLISYKSTKTKNGQYVLTEMYAHECLLENCPRKFLTIRAREEHYLNCHTDHLQHDICCTTLYTAPPNQLPFPCPLRGCSGQCLSMNSLREHFKNDHNLPDDEIVTYKSKKVHGKYVLKTHKIHECKFSTCKKLFYSIRKMEEHYLRSHIGETSMKASAMSEIGVTEARIVEPSLPEDVILVGEDVAPLAALPFPCPTLGCTVQCATSEELQNHMKRDHLISKDCLVIYDSVRAGDGRYILKPKHLHACNFVGCKQKFPSIHSAEMHYVKAHADASGSEVNKRGVLCYPCPQLFCRVQCASSLELMCHMSKTHQIPDDELISYKSKKKRGTYVLCPRNIHSCPHINCGNMFTTIRAAELHYVAKHGDKATHTKVSPVP